MVLKLFKRLVGDADSSTSAPAISADPFGRDPAPESAVPPAPTFRTLPPGETAVLQRDEIIDGNTRLAGYRFSARLPAARGARADARATFAVLGEGRLAAFGERRLALIPLDVADWPNYDWRALIAAHTVFELEAPAEVSTEWLAVANDIRAAGARIALTRVVPDRDAALLDEIASFVIGDLAGTPLAELRQQAETLRQRHPHLQLIAEGVASWGERRLCITAGAAYCIGDFATRPDEENTRDDINGSRLTLLEMLNKVRQDADLAELGDIAKRDPDVTLQLVAMANAPAFGLTRSVTSVDQAIMLVGREQLYRWLAISMFRTGTDSPRDGALLELALARGRFLELIAQGRHGKADSDELFLVGLLSLMDSLLGVPMEALLARIKLNSALNEVLLHSNGPWGRYLMLAIAVEKGRVQQVTSLAATLDLPPDDVHAASIAALAWAEEACQLSRP